MHEIIPPLKRGLIRAPRGIKVKRLGVAPESKLPRAGYLEARLRILKTYGKQVKIPEKLRTRRLSVGHSRAELVRLFKSPKLTGPVQSEYLLCLEPYVKKIAPTAAVVGVGGIDRIRKQPAKIPTKKMRSWVQILTTPTADTPGTTLLLHFDTRRYLIGNIGEGSQRACVQRGIGMSKIENIFLTGKIGWGTAGGLIGMILTLADVTTTARADLAPRKKRDEGPYVDALPRLSLHGGNNLTHMLATTRRFVFRKGMPVDVNEIKESQESKRNGDCKPSWSDDNIKVWAMPISPGASRTQRKRSHDEMEEGPPTMLETSIGGVLETTEEAEDRKDQIRKGVLSHMFDSDWRLDALKNVKLKDVYRPESTKIFVRNSQGNIEKYTGILPGGDELVPDIDVLIRNPWPGALIESLPATTPSLEAMSYIIKNHPQRGKFNPKDATRLGVKPGPDFRKLTLGESVETADGRVITPDMVLAPGKEGGGFAVVELPDASYLDPLINRPEWLSEEVMNGVGAIVWILGEGFVAHDRLQTFLQKFEHLEHIFSQPGLCSNPIAFESSTTAALKLNLLDPEHFPVPVYDNGDTTEPAMSLAAANHRAKAGVVLQLEPKFEIQNQKAVPDFDIKKAVEEMDQAALEIAVEARDAYDKARVHTTSTDELDDIPCKNAEVIALGTGSALPSKYRNVSATLLRVPGYGNYLFDCGENTLGQLKRVFGDELPQVLQDLKAIWISHLHADHHLGTAAVIKAWHEETLQHVSTSANKLIISSEEGMLNWLTEYSQVEDYGFSRLQLLPMATSNNLSHQFSEIETQSYGLSSITACRVSHCHGALATVFMFPNGFKAAYSGDCLPSSAFARLGQGATLLIHEATFDDELAGDALAKKHSTTSGALQIGKEMGARRILLTHFSQRYQKIPVMEEEGAEGGKGADVVAVVAFDYMRCKLGEFGKLAVLRPALMKLFEEKDEKDEKEAAVLEEEKRETEKQKEKKEAKLAKQAK